MVKGDSGILHTTDQGMQPFHSYWLARREQHDGALDGCRLLMTTGKDRQQHGYDMKTKYKLRVTQWFPGWAKPQRIGVYQRLYAKSHIGYCFWDGVTWYFDEYPDTKFVSTMQSIAWRGIAR